MSRLGDAVRRSNRALERDTGNEFFVWKGNNYAAVGNVAESSKLLGSGGFELEADLSVFARLEILPDPGPVEKDLITFRGKPYRIERVSVLPGSSIVKLACNSTTKGA